MSKNKKIPLVSSGKEGNELISQLSRALRLHMLVLNPEPDIIRFLAFFYECTPKCTPN